MRYDMQTLELICCAARKARSLGHSYVGSAHLLLALSVQKAAEEMNGVQLPPLEENEENPDETPQPPISPQAAQAKKRMQLSYTGRMLLTVLLAVIALSVPCFKPIAALVPQLFPRLVIQVWAIRQKNGKGV